MDRTKYHRHGGGAEVVCGKTEIFAEDLITLPIDVRRSTIVEGRQLSLLDEIDALIDGDPFDPWPRSTHDSGAIIGLRPGVLKRIGGAPPVAAGEDRALIERCKTVDICIRHDPRIVMPVSRT